MIIVQILIALLFVSGVLIGAPSVVMYRIVFGRKDRPHLSESDLSKTYYAPYAETLLRAFGELQKLPKEPVALYSFDGLRLYGEWYDGGFSKTVIFCHGYGGTPYHQFSPQALALYKAGFNLLFPIQRAHNESEGKHTTLGIFESKDLLLWIEWAKKQPECKEILLYGISMGCSAIEYASDALDHDTIRGMILDCGFTSPWDQLSFDAKKHHLPAKVFLPLIAFYAKRWIGIDLRKDTREFLPKAAVPALFCHGTADRTVPLSQGLKNYEACACEKEKYIVEGAGHTLCYLCGGENAAVVLDQFIQKYFTKKEKNES